MRAFLRDPVLHFAALGVVLFAAFLVLDQNERGPDAIVVSEALQAQLAARFERVWRRPPQPAELDGLIDDWIREELANREAQAMGLQYGDQVVRRRLRQKYESFMDALTSTVTPAESELESWYAEHADDYRTDARYTLRQRFFSRDRREDARADAAAALAVHDPGAATDPGREPAAGDALPLPQRLQDVRLTELRARLGDDFALKLESLPLRHWTGPVPSAFGYHLVFIEERRPSQIPMLADVRDAALRDWRAQQQKDARESLYAELRDRYDVQIR